MDGGLETMLYELTTPGDGVKFSATLDCDMSPGWMPVTAAGVVVYGLRLEATPPKPAAFDDWITKV
jgi:hypothetical protein